MIRKIIRIDEEKCNGCGAFAAACHEGAIGMVEGKARALRERFSATDWATACPASRRTQLTFVEREAAAYNDRGAARAKKREQNRQGEVLHLRLPGYAIRASGGENATCGEHPAGGGGGSSRLSQCHTDRLVHS